MAGFLSKLNKAKSNLLTPNKIMVQGARSNTTWTDDNDPRIIYYLRPRARRISIKMDTAGRRVSVTVPGSERRLKDAQKFVREKYDWILVQLEAMPIAQPYVDGGEVLFRGQTYTLYSPSPRGHPYFDEEQRHLIVPAHADTLSGRTKRFLIREARTALTNCTHVHAGALGKTVNKISVRDTSSRWGSCVSRKSGTHISYSWRLICAPPYVLDYVAAHECAHLIHPDHSKNFWGLCDELVDTVNPAKAWLKRHGDKLHAVGAEV
ncbi:MAG: M48 family metallopeptidase [Robiginitomaculum sp.]|nr:M48 family metallopeptidase [Robiginitomaculum sp.]